VTAQNIYAAGPYQGGVVPRNGGALMRSVREQDSKYGRAAMGRIMTYSTTLNQVLGSSPSDNFTTYNFAANLNGAPQQSTLQYRSADITVPDARQFLLLSFQVASASIANANGYLRLLLNGQIVYDGFQLHDLAVSQNTAVASTTYPMRPLLTLHFDTVRLFNFSTSIGIASYAFMVATGDARIDNLVTA
jgi:hypothetical protein